MQKHSPWSASLLAVVAVSVSAAASATLVGSLAARILFVQDTAPVELQPVESPPTGLDERWRSDLLRSLDDQLRNMKDLERNANQSKDQGFLFEIQNFRSTVEGQKNCIQNASTQEALQACNDAMQSMGDASSKLWLRSDIANVQRELTDMERQIKDGEREKTDMTKTKALLEQIRAAIGNVQNLLQSGADQRDVRDAMQDTVDPLKQEFYNTINTARRQGETARFRKEQLKNMEKELQNIERSKGDTTKLKEIAGRVNAALTEAERLMQSGADNRDIDDAFRVLYDTEREFWDIQSAANRGRELKDRENDVKSMERELKNIEKQKGTNVEKLRQTLDSYKSQLAELQKLVESGTADPQTINDAFQDFYNANGQQEFWNAAQAGSRTRELKDREKDLKNMERELSRMEKQKGTNAQELRLSFENYKSQLAELRKLVESNADPDAVNDAFNDFYSDNHSQKFWDLQNAANQAMEMQRWTKKGGEISRMEQDIKRLKRDKADTSALQSLVDQMKAKIQEIQGLSPEEQQDAVEEVQELQNEFWNTVNALNMKGELRQWTRKGGHLAKMQKIVDALRKKGKDAGPAESALQQIRAVVADLEQSTDRDTLEEGRHELDDLRRQFEEAILPFMKKKTKGFPFPMKKG